MCSRIFHQTIFGFYGSVRFRTVKPSFGCFVLFWTVSDSLQYKLRRWSCNNQTWLLQKTWFPNTEIKRFSSNKPEWIFFRPSMDLRYFKSWYTIVRREMTSFLGSTFSSMTSLRELSLCKKKKEILVLYTVNEEALSRFPRSVYYFVFEIMSSWVKQLRRSHFIH